MKFGSDFDASCRMIFEVINLSKPGTYITHNAS